MQQDEDALHAGVAAVQVMKGMFTSACAPNKLSEEVLRLVLIAISRLRERIARKNSCNDEVTIMTVVFLTHLAVSAKHPPDPHESPYSLLQMVFRDMDAFRLHRKAIKSMVDSRGGLDKLNQGSLVASTVRQ
jgi:hypothetical protein